MQLSFIELVKSWPKPNYVNPVTRGSGTVILHLVFYPLVFMALSIRLYTRVRICKSFGLDDWLITATFFPMTAFIIISLLMEHQWQWDRHVWDMRVPMIVLGTKAIIATQALFAVATGLTKCSVLTLVYRVVSKDKRLMAKIVLAAIIFIVAQNIAYCFMVVFECRPISLTSSIHVEAPETCVIKPLHLLVAGCISTFADLITVLLPMPTVLSLHLPSRQQTIAVLLFAAGFLVTAAGAVRTYYTFKAGVSTDPTWMIYGVWVSSSIEMYVGIICATLPATRKFFSIFLPRLLGTHMFTSSKHSSQKPLNSLLPHNSVADTVETDVELGHYEGDFGRLNGTGKRPKSMPNTVITEPDSSILDGYSKEIFTRPNNGSIPNRTRSMTLGRLSSPVTKSERMSAVDEVADIGARRMSESSNVSLSPSKSHSSFPFTRALIPGRTPLTARRGSVQHGEAGQDADLSPSISPVEATWTDSVLIASTIHKNLHKYRSKVDLDQEAVAVPRDGRRSISKRSWEGSMYFKDTDER